MENRVLIIGGGIGGVALAAGLRKEGVPFALFEAAPAIRETGLGVGIGCGAINAMCAIGLAGGLREIASAPLETMRVMTHDGRQLADWPRYNAEVSVRRQDLLRVLRSGVDDDDLIYPGRRCVDVHQDENRVTARFADGSEEHGAALVGADGVRSVVRGCLWGKTDLRYGGYTEWRGIVDQRFDGAPDGLIVVVLGPGGSVGISTLCGGSTFWFSKTARPEGSGDPPKGRKQDLLDTFGDWTDPVGAMMGATPVESTDRQDVFDREPLKAWSRERATLLGDAAHPTTPSLGAGAGMTIEDAAVLAHRLAAVDDLGNGQTVAAALRLYERERIPPTTKIVNASRRFSNMVTWRHPLLVAARAQMLRRAPERLLRRNAERDVVIDLSNGLSEP